jgi:multidrug efflux system membrane fusion protein
LRNPGSLAPLFRRAPGRKNQSAGSNNRRKLRPMKIHTLAMLAAPILLAGCGAKAPAPPPPPAVGVAEVIERNIADFDEFSGRLEAVETVEIRPRVSGYIQSVNFGEGKEIRKGDLLFVIDPRPSQAALARATAELARATAQADLARGERVRADQLLAAHVISQDDYDRRVAAAREAEAAVQSAEAAVTTARLDLSYTRVTSPIDGRVGRAEITVGNLVNGGSNGGSATLLTTVVSLDPMYVYFEGSEQDYLRYGGMARRGERPSSRDYPNPIEMGLANEEGFPHKGHMDFVDNHVNPATGTIRARAVFDNKDRSLTPGLFARLRLIGSGLYKAMLVDDRSVGTDQDRKFVYVVDAGNKVEYRKVTLGPKSEGLRVVKDGLAAGDRVVVDGLQRVRPGMTVQPEKVAMNAANLPPGSTQAAAHADR